MLKYNVSRQAIYSAICVTLKGNRWFSHSEKGGGDGYLGDVEIDKFKTRISEASGILNCIKTIEAVQICYELRTERYLRAVFLSEFVKHLDSAVRIRKTILGLEPYMPSKSWISKFSSTNGIKLKLPETIEEARRRYCQLKQQWHVT